MKSSIQIVPFHFFLKILLSAFFVPLLVSQVWAQDAVTEIEHAFRGGKARELSRFFDREVDMSFSDRNNTYGREEAASVMQKFFAKTEPKEFRKLSGGTSRQNSTHFMIGLLSTSLGTYRVYLFYLQKNKNCLIREIRVEKY